MTQETEKSAFANYRDVVKIVEARCKVNMTTCDVDEAYIVAKNVMMGAFDSDDQQQDIDDTLAVRRFVEDYRAGEFDR